MRFCVAGMKRVLVRLHDSAIHEFVFNTKWCYVNSERMLLSFVSALSFVFSHCRIDMILLSRVHSAALFRAVRISL